MTESYRYMADLSSNNVGDRLDFNLYAKAGHTAIGIKATQGTVYLNPYHAQWCEAAHAEKLAVVHYHFTNLNREVEKECRFFEEKTAPFFKNGDRLCLDVEILKTDSGQAEPWSFTPTFLEYFYKRNREPWVYSNEDFILEHLRNVYPRSGFWVASYGKVPMVRDEIAWQYSEKETFAGFSGLVDGSRLSEPLAKELRRERTIRRIVRI